MPANKNEIKTMLDKLPDVYAQDLYEQNCLVVYQHFYGSYYEAGRSVYARLE